MDNLDPVDLWGGRLPFRYFRVRPEVEDVGDPECFELRFAWLVGVSSRPDCGSDKAHTLPCYARDLTGPVYQRRLRDEGWISSLVRTEVSDIEYAVDCDEGRLLEPCFDIVLV